jgi:iron complex outermembrane receptor protein
MTCSAHVRRAFVCVLLAAGGLTWATSRLSAQDSTSRSTLRVTVRSDSAAVPGAVVRADAMVGRTNDRGEAVLLLAAGAHVVTIARIGFRPETLSVVLRVGLDTALVVPLLAQAAEIEQVIVAATRSDRRIEDVPLRVEVLSRDEVEEKMLMTPGDISMMLNETGGLRVQSTSPSLGGAGIRVQGLRGRYTLLLSDGLPLHGGQASSFGLLQIPPMDLAQVEVIKGVASALYGSAALGGVVNLVSRRPRDEPERELLANQTSRGGSDLVGWASDKLNERWGYTVLASGHRQSRVDVDGDGWTDLPGYERGVVRPRFFWTGADGRNALFTLGTTLEQRRGGTLPDGLAPDGAPYGESLDTRRFDAGAIGSIPLGAGYLSVRGSGTVQLHGHQFGTIRERDRHETYFAEATLRTSRGSQSGVLGLAIEQENYSATDVARFDYRYTTPAAFVQYDVEPAKRLAMSASMRLDAHSAFGTFLNPRLSMLLRGPEGWTARISMGTGAFAPTPFTEETEVTGLTPVRPLVNVRAERARSASLDIGGVVGPFEVNATVFGSRIASPLQTRAVAAAPSEVEIVNASEPTRTSGADGLVRLRTGSVSTTATYAYVRSTEQDPVGGLRQTVALTPTHAAGLTSVWEREGRGRAGIEVYYTGSQTLDDNPYRRESPAYLLFGAMAEHRVGLARVFVNLENLGNVRMTTYQPLVRPTRGLGGRWTTDAWAPLDGRTINAGLRFAFGPPGD